MSLKKQLVKEIINSLMEKSEEWAFDEYLAHNSNWWIKIWITNIPILSLYIYKPTPIRFSLPDRYRIYKALSVCRINHILQLNKKHGK